MNSVDLGIGGVGISVWPWGGVIGFFVRFVDWFWPKISSWQLPKFPGTKRCQNSSSCNFSFLVKFPSVVDHPTMGGDRNGGGKQTCFCIFPTFFCLFLIFFKKNALLFWVFLLHFFDCVLFSVFLCLQFLDFYCFFF